MCKRLKEWNGRVWKDRERKGGSKMWGVREIINREIERWTNVMTDEGKKGV